MSGSRFKLKWKNYYFLFFIKCFGDHVSCVKYKTESVYKTKKNNNNNK